jgi:hypothetical protein
MREYILPHLLSLSGRLSLLLSLKTFAIACDCIMSYGQL